jgi:hypothetical protein
MAFFSCGRFFCGCSVIESRYCPFPTIYNKTMSDSDSDYEIDDLACLRHRPNETYILNETTNYIDWEKELQCTLFIAMCASHIFHDTGLAPIHAPTQKATETEQEYKDREEDYNHWMYKELQAAEIVNAYLPQEWRIVYAGYGVPAKRFYDAEINDYKRGRVEKIHELTRKFWDVKIEHEDTYQYIVDFLAVYRELEDVTTMFCELNNTSFEDYMVPEGSAKLHFFQRTLDVDWLEPWRRSVKLGKTSLWDLVASLFRQRSPHGVDYHKEKCTMCPLYVSDLQRRFREDEVGRRKKEESKPSSKRKGTAGVQGQNKRVRAN